MATNLDIEPELLEQALKVSGERTRTAAVGRALQEYVARHEQRHPAELFGALEWDRDYDHKAERLRIESCSMPCSSAKATAASKTRSLVRGVRDADESVVGVACATACTPRPPSSSRRRSWCATGASLPAGLPGLSPVWA